MLYLCDTCILIDYLRGKEEANALLKDIERGGYDGIGKPEPLKGNLSGYYSRRIDDYNRIVYKIENNIIEIVQCGTHYHD